MKQAEYIEENFTYNEEDDRYEHNGHLFITYYHGVGFYYEPRNVSFEMSFEEVMKLIEVDKILERLMME